MPPTFPHPFSFDPGYGYELDGLLAVTAPEAPPDFVDFWRARYENALSLPPRPRLTELAVTEDPFREDNHHVSRTLWNKSIANGLHEWDGRAHEGYSWRRMAPLYL